MGIGRHIVEFERGGKRAVYGQELLKVIARNWSRGWQRVFLAQSLFDVPFYEGFSRPKHFADTVCKIALVKPLSNSLGAGIGSA